MTKPSDVRTRGLSRLRGEPADAKLAVLAAAGDADAFERIYARHHLRLLAYCRHTLANVADAEDALQQTFISAHKSLLDSGTPRELMPWLYAIARNKCRDVYAKRPAAVELSDALPLAGLSDPVQQREDLRVLLADIASLPEQQRSALLLSELEGMAHKSIADVVGCTEAKVRALIYQARSTLIADRTARETPCETIREQLSVGQAGALRRGPLRRHLSGCHGCTSFAVAVREQRAALGLALPVIPAAGLLRDALGSGAGTSAGGHAAIVGHAAGAGATTAASSAAAGGGAASAVGVVTAAKVVAALALSAAAVAGVNAISTSPAKPAAASSLAAQSAIDAGRLVTTATPVGSSVVTSGAQPQAASSGKSAKSNATASSKVASATSEGTADSPANASLTSSAAGSAVVGPRAVARTPVRRVARRAAPVRTRTRRARTRTTRASRTTTTTPATVATTTTTAPTVTRRRKTVTRTSTTTRTRTRRTVSSRAQRSG